MGVQKFLTLAGKVGEFSTGRTGGEKGRARPCCFDLVRASVNLTVAIMLIAFATSLKLPLSTTYVSFMVAMGTSLVSRGLGAG